MPSLLLHVRFPDGTVVARRFDGARVTVGRRLDADLVLPDPVVSGEHAVFEHSDQGWSVTDVGSTNGVALAGAPITPHVPVPVADAATLLIGPFLLTVDLHAVGAAPRLAPELASATAFDVRLAQGSRDAPSWDRLSGRIVETLRSRFGHSVLPPLYDFDDFTSEVMVLVLRDIATFEDRGKGSFWAWVHRLALHRLQDLWRLHTASRRGGRRQTSDADVDALSDPRALSATQAMLVSELEGIELDCLRELGADAQTVYLLRRREELDFDVIAARVRSVSEGAARATWKRARDHVRRCIARKTDLLGDRVRDSE